MRTSTVIRIRTVADSRYSRHSDLHFPCKFHLQIIRGDGKSGIRSGDCLDPQLPQYPFEEVDLVLTNPPFGKEKKSAKIRANASGTPETVNKNDSDNSGDATGTLPIVKKGMAAVKPGGHYLSVLPDVILRGAKARVRDSSIDSSRTAGRVSGCAQCRKAQSRLPHTILPSLPLSQTYAKWRTDVLEGWDLLAVIQLPKETFKPYADTGTNVRFLLTTAARRIHTREGD